MAKFLLDTGILLGLIRKSQWAGDVAKALGVFEPSNFAYISSITRVELKAMAYRLNWGEKKSENLNELLRTIPTVDINNEKIESKYIEINAYSENKHHDLKLPEGQSPFKMGDHDIWIAATAATLNAQLLTTDKDFDSIDGVFIKRIYVEQKKE